MSIAILDVLVKEVSAKAATASEQVVCSIDCQGHRISMYKGA